MPTPDQNYLSLNRELWNAKVPYHLQSELYAQEAFMAGATSLQSIELEQVGDVMGKTLLHLQCHYGQDTLSWARLGARATGIDLSDAAIATARELNDKLGLDARFVCCNVYDVPEQIDEQFDIVFTSYGTIGWLPDLEKWGQVIHKMLKPGGEFHFIEFHPVIWMFDDDFKYIAYSYFQQDAIVEETQGTYADREAPIKNTSVSWNHSIDQVLGTLLRQGLRIEHFAEYDWSPYKSFPRMTPARHGGWYLEGYEGKLPMVYALKATKPE